MLCEFVLPFEISEYHNGSSATVYELFYLKGANYETPESFLCQDISRKCQGQQRLNTSSIATWTFEADIASAESAREEISPFLVQLLWRFPRLLSHFVGKSSKEGCENERFKQQMCERNKKLFWKGTSPKISSHIGLFLTVSLTKPYSISRAPKGKVTNSDWFESMRIEDPSKKHSAMETPPNAHAHERVVFWRALDLKSI